MKHCNGRKIENCLAAVVHVRIPPGPHSRKRLQAYLQVGARYLVIPIALQAIALVGRMFT